MSAQAVRDLLVRATRDHSVMEAQYRYNLYMYMKFGICDKKENVAVINIEMPTPEKSVTQSVC